MLTLRLREHQRHGNCHHQKPWYCRDRVCPPAENTQHIQSLKMETAQILLRLHVMLTENKIHSLGCHSTFLQLLLHLYMAVALTSQSVPEVKQDGLTENSMYVEDNCSPQALSRSMFILQRPIRKMVKKEKTIWSVLPFLLVLGCSLVMMHSEQDLWCWALSVEPQEQQATHLCSP